MALMIMVSIDAVDPSDGSTKTLRVTNQNSRDATNLNSVTWLPVLLELGELGMTIFDGDFTGTISSQIGSLRLRATSKLNDAWAGYVFDGQRVQVWVGPLGTAWGSLTKVFDGLSGPMKRDLNEYSIDLKSPTEVAKNLVETTSYAGTGGAEGLPEMKGKIKPYVIGAPKNIEPVLVDPAKQIYQVSTTYATNSLTVFENGIGYTYQSALYSTNYATWAAGASPDPGKFSTCLDASLGYFFRLGAEPSGVITCDADPAGTGVGVKIGDAVRTLLTRAGMPSWRIDAANVTAMNTATGNATVSWYFPGGDGQSVEDAIQTILAGVGGYYGFDQNGTLIMGLTRFGSSTATLSHARDASPVVRAMQQLSTSAPHWRVALNAQRVWRVQESGEISDALRVAAEAAQTAANNAQTAANAAQTSANTALAKLNNIASDGWLTGAEKKEAERDWQDIVNEQTGLLAQASSLGITTEATALTSAKNALAAYLVAMSPAWDDETADTAVVRATWIATWGTYYTARQTLVNKIAAVAATLANWSGVTNDNGGLPSDHAGTSGILTAIGSYTTVRGNSTYKTGGTHGAFQGGAVGQALYGTAFVSCSILNAVAGGGWITTLQLDDDATTVAANGSSSINYEFRINVTGSGNYDWALYAGASGVASGSGATGLTANSRASVVYDGVNVYAIVDGVVKGQVSNVAAGQKLFPKVIDFYNNGSTMPTVDIIYGPWSVAAWSFIGGLNRPADNATRGTNMVVNGDAENNTTDGWYADTNYPPTFSVSSTNTKSGTRSFVITKGSTAQTVQLCGRAIAVVPGKRYIYRVWIKGASATGSGLYVRLNQCATFPALGFVDTSTAAATTDCITANGATSASAQAQNGPTPSTYTLYEMIWTCPSGTAYISPCIIPWSGAPTIYFDQVEFYELIDFVGIGGDTAPSPNATSDLSLVVGSYSNPVTIAGNNYTKGGISDWDTFVASRDALKGTVSTTFVFPDQTKSVMAGLTRTPAGYSTTPLASQYLAVEFGIYKVGNGTQYIWYGSSGQEDLGTSKNGVTFGANTVWRVDIDNISARFYADGVLMHTYTGVTANQVWYFGSAAYTAVGQVTKIGLSLYGDVTANEQVAGTQPVDQDVYYDYTGTAKTGQLTRVLTNYLKKGGADISSSATWTFTPGGCTITAGSNGNVTLNTVTATNATIAVKATYLGKDYTWTIKITRHQDDPPSGGTTATSFVGGVYGNVNQSAYTTPVVIATGTMLSNGSGQVRLSATVNYQAGAGVSASIDVKWQRSPAGTNTWTDTGISGTGTTSVGSSGALDDFGTTGSASTGSSMATGMSNNTAYDFRLIAKYNTAAMTVWGDVAGAQS